MDGSSDPQWRAAIRLETAAKLLRLLKRVLTISSKHALKSLYNQADFDSTIRRFDPLPPQPQFIQPNQALLDKSGFSF